MSIGTFPHVAWDGREFDDGNRLSLAGTALLFHACLVAIKGDWAEYCITLGFGNWSLHEAPCLLCLADWQSWLLEEHCTIGQNPFQDMTYALYDMFCRASEIEVQVTSEIALLIREALFDDRRDAGARGRGLRYDIAGTPLKAGDRLEPSIYLIDVGCLDKLSHFPTPSIFWRGSRDT